MQQHQINDAEQDLQRHFLPLGQALVLLFYHLEVVIQKADAAEQQRQYQAVEHPGAHDGRHRIAHGIGVQEQIGHDHRDGDPDDEHQAAHGGGPLLALVPLGTDLQNSLPKMQAAQHRQQPKAPDGGDHTGHQYGHNDSGNIHDALPFFVMRDTRGKTRR